MAPQTYSSGLQIVICGAGIAGLAAAAALAPRHRILVLDRKTALEEAAFAINLKPNASLAAYGVVGLDPLWLPGLPCREIIERDALGGAVRMRKDVDAPADFGGPWHFCRREDLHGELLRVAVSRGVEVRVDSEVDLVPSTKGGRDAVTVNGEMLDPDLFLVADGISSRLRSKVLRLDADYRCDSGQVAFRAFVPAQAYSQVPELQWLAQPSHGGLYVWAAPKQRLVVYPCPGFVNVVAIVDKDVLLDTSAQEDLRRPSQEMAYRMRAQFSHFHSLSRGVLERATEASLWPLVDLSPLPHYHRDNMLLIGDAGHATLPHQGQGASLAFEDAEGLAHLFCSGPTTPGADQVPNLLARFTALRKERVHMVQEVSRRMAKPAAYDRGEVLNALRFASKVLTYRGMEELEKGIAENGGQAGSERSKLEATEKAHRLRSGAGVKQE